MIVNLESLSGGGGERIEEFLSDPSVEFDLLYPGVNERFNELLAESAGQGKSAGFIEKWGTFPWAMAFSPTFKKLVEIRDESIMNDGRPLPAFRRRYIHIFPAIKEAEYYRITSPRAEEPSKLRWLASSNGTWPWGTNTDVHFCLGDWAEFLCVMSSEDLAVVPYRNVWLTRDPL